MMVFSSARRHNAAVDELEKNDVTARYHCIYVDAP